MWVLSGMKETKLLLVRSFKVQVLNFSWAHCSQCVCGGVCVWSWMERKGDSLCLEEEGWDWERVQLQARTHFRNATQSESWVRPTPTPPAFQPWAEGRGGGRLCGRRVGEDHGPEGGGTNSLSLELLSQVFRAHIPGHKVANRMQWKVPEKSAESTNSCKPVDLNWCNYADEVNTKQGLKQNNSWQ